MSRKATIVFISIFLFCLVEGISSASEWTPLITLKEKTLSYLASLEGKIISVSSENIVIDIGKREGANNGMRLKVLRQGIPFYHPVTGELVGNAEVPVGVVEITETGNIISKCRVISGEAKEGDIVRSSGQNTRVLFYQDDSVDYFLGDAYYRELKKSGLVVLVDAPIEPMNKEQLLRLAGEKKTEMIIALSSEIEGGIILKQTLMWKDGSVVSTDKVLIPREMIAKLREENKFFLTPQNEALLRFSIPIDAENLTVTDIDGDHNLEMIISTDTDIYIYRYDIDLELQGRIKGKTTEEIIWLDTADLNRDGKRELVVSTISDKRDHVYSYVYRVIPPNSIQGDFRLEKLWQTEGFVRVLNNGLIYQKYSPVDGYTGPIRRVVYNNGDFSIKEEIKEFPPIINIYDFGEMRDNNGDIYYLYIDDEAYLNLLNPEGLVLWRSSNNLGGFKRSFDKGAAPIIVEMGKWHIKNRIVTEKTHALVVKKEPLIKQARTIWYKNSQLLLVWIASGILQQSVIIESISGEVLDYAVFDNKVAVLSKPLFGLKAKNILKGKNPFGTYVQIFSIKGG
jgi:hypothetical protein